MLGKLPQAIWHGIDYSELAGLFDAYAFLNGGQTAEAVAPLDDYDRLLIEQEKARLAAQHTQA